MNTLQCLLLLSLAVFSVIDAGVIPSEGEETSITCYSCQSEFEGPCDDPEANQVDTIECTNSFATCYYYVQNWFEPENIEGDKFVARGCTEGWFCPNTGGENYSCETCWGGDLCNNQIFDGTPFVVKNSTSKVEKKHTTSFFKNA